MESPQEGYSLPTIGGFWRFVNNVAGYLTLRTFKSSNPVTGGKPELENSGKVIMPVSALEELSQFDLENTNPYTFSSPYGALATSNSLQSSPILFELSTGKGKRSFCGVEEFTAEEGTQLIYLTDS